MASTGRDVLVTGMGFCLPGPGGAVCRTPGELWETVSTGRSHLDNDGFFRGRVNLSDEEFGAAVPGIPQRYLRNYADVHRYGLLSLVEACQDAGFDWRGGELQDAAVLTARASVDNSVDTYLACMQADPRSIGLRDARALFTRLAVSATATDVANVQASLLANGGPSYTVSCGCASSAVLIGVAANLIAGGEVEVAAVTGVDTFDTDRLQHFEELKAASGAQPTSTTPAARIRWDGPMRPYDERACGFNIGDGSATLILESREHSRRRGAEPYGRVLGQATTRGKAQSALTVDDSGEPLARAAEKCLRGNGSRAAIAPSDIGYVNGGAEGDPLFHRIEYNGVRAVFGAHTENVVVSSQEACFGHNAAPLGNIGAAATMLMMRNGVAAPTANCEKPVTDAPFEIVAAGGPRPLDFDLALSFNYQLGGVSSALLVGSPEGC
ncbi:hypothetical protein LZ318_22030 [Saccharopolyspora indica]|uniref:beta-ketoacyl-[acyl-carrier-protein] synthase family protein n=1 Tax=Saccharopolyspora indica TaxID=1229659 RepID=UPI0022EA8A20|nr:beta-ketoacyl synthase N-terminal-like domain-containing protein [Saccharopolyspora indica]MDA3648115.1 beta-ketoacyl synthase N-terminal-like domain-containing protein [Saccharopolyspora indica]